MSYIEEAKDLHAMGESIEAIMDRLSLSRKQVQYICGDYVNSPPRKYIKDEKKREKEIMRIRALGTNKTYKDRAFLQYLAGKWNKDMYESVYYN